MDKLTVGLEEKGGVTERARQRVLTLLRRRGVFKRTPEGITIFVAKAMHRMGPNAAYWRRSLQLRLEQRIQSGSFHLREILFNRQIALLLQGPLVDRVAMERTLSHLQDEKFWEKVWLRDIELHGEQETDWVLEMLWNSRWVLLHGSFINGFLRPDSDIDIVFLPKGKVHPAGRVMMMEVPLKGRGQPRVAFHVLAPQQAEALLKSPGLPLTTDRVLIREESGWRLNGESLAALFRMNHEIRDGIRSTAKATGQPLSETEIAHQALAIQQKKIAAQSAAGLEEQEDRPGGGLFRPMNRRTFLGQMMAAWTEAETGLLGRVVEAQSASASIQRAVEFFVRLETSGIESILEEMIRQPEIHAQEWGTFDVLDYFEHHNTEWQAILREDPEADPHAYYHERAADRFDAQIARKMQWVVTAAEHLGGDSLPPLPEASSESERGAQGLNGLIRATEGKGSAEEMVRLWRYLAQAVFQKRNRRVRQFETAGTADELSRARASLEAVQDIQRDLKILVDLPLERQKAVLTEIIQANRARMAALWDRVRPAVHAEFEKLRTTYRKQLEARREHQVEQAEEELRRQNQGRAVRVPPSAIFIAIGSSRQNRFLDDWNLLKKEVAGHETFRGIRLVRAELPAGMARVDFAQQVARRTAAQNPQAVIGIALGLIPEDQAMDLDAFWPDWIRTDDPALFVSFVYTPQEKVEQRWADKKAPLASYSTLFSAWVSDPQSGRMPVVPGLELPITLWGRLEERIRAQVGLEQAA